MTRSRSSHACVHFGGGKMLNSQIAEPQAPEANPPWLGPHQLKAQSRTAAAGPGPWAAAGLSPAPWHCVPPPSPLAQAHPPAQHHLHHLCLGIQGSWICIYFKAMTGCINAQAWIPHLPFHPHAVEWAARKTTKKGSCFLPAGNADSDSKSIAEALMRDCFLPDWCRHQAQPVESSI